MKKRFTYSVDTMVSVVADSEDWPEYDFNDENSMEDLAIQLTNDAMDELLNEYAAGTLYLCHESTEDE